MDTIGEYFVNPLGPSDLQHYPLLNSVVPLTVLTVVYLVFVLKLGPWLMRDRKPMQLKGVILGYNILQILMNAYMFFTGLLTLHNPPIFGFLCIGRLPQTHRYYSVVSLAHYLYFLNKVIDYMDTIFFVLRKSNKQVTFLHLYHHIMMSYISYMINHYYGSGGQHAFVGVLNSLVHVLMYAYYTASAINPDVKETHWKRNITHIQLIQFVVGLLHFTSMSSACQYPPVLYYLNVSQGFTMIALFSNFYLKTYILKKQPTAKSKTSASTTTTSATKSQKTKGIKAS